MEKMVQVVDEVGNRYEATFPKRAKGLVKNGRARFIDENTICLARPPKNIQNSEDMNMTNNNAEHKTIEIAATKMDTNKTLEDKYTIAYALEQIEKITNCATASVNIFQEMYQFNGMSDIGFQEMTEMFRIKETTNQQLIAFYSKMIDDLSPKKESITDSRKEFMNWVKDCIAAQKPGTMPPDFEKLWKMMNA